VCENLEVWVSHNYSFKKGNLLTNHYRERTGKNTKYRQNQGVLYRAVDNIAETYTAFVIKQKANQMSLYENTVILRMCDVRSGDCLTQKRSFVGVQTVQRHRKWDTPLWCVEASTSADIVNAVHEGMDLSTITT
jgi:hypothetical protein